MPDVPQPTPAASLPVPSPGPRPTDAAAAPQRDAVRVPLTQLKRGDRAIVDLEKLGAEDSRLLAAMGLEHQAEVRVCRAGTPCIVQIEATRLGISAEVAAQIIATPCSCFPDVDGRGLSDPRVDACDCHPADGAAPAPQTPPRETGPKSGGRP